MKAKPPAPPEPILHVDMDAFYASVEVRADPSLAGQPVAVGGGGPRGVVTSASYEARRFGVRSAMPTVRARRMCPDLILVPPNFTLYRAESRAILTIFLSFTPMVEMASLDEAYLDVGGSVRLFGAPPEIGRAVRERVRAERDLVCSVGVAPNKHLAKLASAAAKPDGLVHVRAHDVRAFLDPLPVGALMGVGAQTEAALERLGVRTVGDLRALPAGVLDRQFGPGPASHLRMLAAGEDDREVQPYEAAKQVSAEETFPRDIDREAQIHRELLRLADRVSSRLREAGVSARTVTIKVRFSDFRTVTRSRTLAAPTDVAAKVYATARDLFAGMKLTRPRVRLLGIAATSLVPGTGPEQLLLGARPDRWRDADRVVDRLRARFGADAIERATTAEPRERLQRRPGPGTKRGDRR